MRIAGRAEGPADVIAVADFVPRSAAGVVIGLDVRCSDTACVGIKFRMPNEFHLTEGTKASVDDLYAAAYPLSANHPHRAVLSVVGSHLKAWVDGTPSDEVTTADLSSGYVTFSIYDESGASVAVDVVRFFAYLPAAA